MAVYDAVVFDMDGVIFDSERCVFECWKEIADKYGIKEIEKNFLACTGTTMSRTREIMLEAYGAEFPYEEFAHEASVIFHERYDNGKLPVKAGVFELLDYLKEQGKKIALATSTRRQTVLYQLEQAGILKYFDEIITGDMVTKSKPDPEIYRMACEKIGVDPQNAFAIEDSYNGIRSAQAGGLRAIMVPDLLPADEEMKELAEVVLPSLNDVIRYIGNEGGKK
ncbi:MAG: HAD family phosphatase [Lachnospiraceae bacterium]|nr:HAD family phosphatase [Lachnospiraceae bacterium]